MIGFQKEVTKSDSWRDARREVLSEKDAITLGVKALVDDEISDSSFDRAAV